MQSASPAPVPRRLAGLLLGLGLTLGIGACGKPYNVDAGVGDGGTDLRKPRDLLGADLVAVDLTMTNPGDGPAPPDLATPDLVPGPDLWLPGATCKTTFRYKPSASGTYAVAGEFNGWNVGALPMTDPDGDGTYTATADLEPGLWAYKIVANGNDWRLDSGQARRKYINNVENSAILVRDCRVPSLAVASSQVARPAAGQGSYQAQLTYRDGADASGPDAAGFTFTLDDEGTARALTGSEASVDGQGNVTIKVAGLADGKYKITARPRSKSGRTGEPLRLIFWVEAAPFSWKDAVVYMIVTDRYRDGDPAGNAPATPNADPRGDWKGGDLQGITKAISDGTLDQLGVRALWLTPFNTNPSGAYKAQDNIHYVTGYHGYWPSKAREVDPRIGGEKALRDLVKEAHKHGIRILQDYVMNHVHEEHEYFKQHPDWFRTGCVCGTTNCDWTGHALDCMFATYMPDINYTVPAATAQFVDDAVWWLDSFNLDGLRVDAVKHVEEVATRNLAAAVREDLEHAGTRFFLMGETAMGWSDCADPCNDENYNTILKYIGPHGLDGQFDFVLYHGVSYRTFAQSDKGMFHADYWTRHALSRWGDAIMTPYIGSHDTARFATLADYRGQAGRDRSVPGRQWDNVAQAPTDAEPYWRTRVGLAWLLGLPGAPLLYYGDEYGQWGGADPNNRQMWRPEAQLTTDEKATLAFTRKLGQARQEVLALRRGRYETALKVTEDTLVMVRKIPAGQPAAGQVALVGLTRAGTPQTLTGLAVGALGLGTGTVLKDRLGGPSVTVSNAGTIDITIPAQSAVVLAP